VTRKINGGQLQAADEELDKHLAKHPDRACFWALKTTIKLELGNLDELRTVSEQFMKVAPENPIALASAALLAAAEEPPEEEMQDERLEPTEPAHRAIGLLQEALECSPEGIPIQIYDALGVLAERLVAEGFYLAGREHLAFQVLLDRENAQVPYAKLIRISRSPSISLLQRQDLTVPPCPEGVSWADEYEDAVGEGSRGLWRKAAEGLERLLEKHQEPTIYRALGVIYCRLAENRKAIDVWRKYASGEGVSHDDAVEAEALAQLLDPASRATKSDLVQVTAPIKELETTLAALQSSPKAKSIPLDPQAFSDEDGPPPKIGFYLSDRALPDAKDVTVDDLPIALCDLLLYGKETDRPARLVYTVPRDRIEDVQAALKELLDDQLEGQPEKEVIGEVPLASTATMVKAQIPREVTPLRRRELAKQFEDKVLLERWTTSPLDVLNGKTPAEAAGDDQLKLALEAAILIIETSTQNGTDDVFDRLREKLKIDLPAKIVPDKDSVRHLPMLRFHRLDARQLDDDDLMTCFAVASQSQFVPAMMRLSEEMIHRESLKDKINRAELYGTMAASVSDPDEALRLTLEAQKAAIKQGRSPARWKVSEFSLRVVRNETAEAQSLLNEIQTRYMKEPGIQEMLMGELTKFGLVRPAPGATAAGGPPVDQAAPAPPVAVASEQPPSPIITSSHPPAPEPGEEKKESKLWLPGD
jgi:tetratricopeptide (TPR) repeat protein